MQNRFILRICLYFDIFILLIIIISKLYYFVFEPDFYSLNINNIKEVQKLDKKDDGFSFAVLGNTKSSINAFDKKLVNKINNDNLDFVISTGNAIADGAEDKYRMLSKSLKKLKIPVIMGIGDNEVSDGGTLRFYKHFGPLYFSFNVNDSYFIFLDTTGETTEAWQREWLIKELINAQKYRYRFVFMNKLPYIIDSNLQFNFKDKYIKSASYRQFLRETFSKYNVTAVFASNAEIFNRGNIDSVSYFISGGGGERLLINNEDSLYYYIKVNVKSSGIKYSIVRLEKATNSIIFQILDNIWVYVNSFFYMNFNNFILVISVLVLIGIIIINKATEDVDYYRKFDDELEHIPNNKKLNIAMFTNNYFPFIGGVPISIDRLAKGLKKQGHQVYIYAPEYPTSYQYENNNTIRCKLLTYYRTKNFNFPIANVFSRKIEEQFISHQIDVVHVHHPFWMGSKGVKLAKKYKVPVVLTYHTRLDKYAHNIPYWGRALFKNKISHYIIRRFSKKCDAVLAPTNTAKEYLRNIGVSKYIEILPTGIDFEEYYSIDNKEIEELKQKYKKKNNIILCSVSRLTKEKNLYFLLEGVKYIKDCTNIPFKCIIVGEGPEKGNLLEIIESSNLKDVVYLVGEISPREIYKYYMASDIFVFASQSETQGMVLLEAMAGKCPVVAIRSSGIEDVISNGDNGFKTKADIRNWSEKIIYLMENPDKLKKMSENAYVFSKLFSIEKMAESATKVYLRIIENRKLTSDAKE
ncbi:hypothetical protein TR13x_05910 [Caloranaerobacter sp. TR13]|uniref:glycosyltransferase n=1 Tax=Caloranaerobacter sp. TR13 TaxID=1302151 RepID=UPI0006D40B61|nr:glycosyltransferase [Caloranaerobacter sp. TR13]KPU27279.1 hypothetical protein TR13x_05910 [Caloranaerobacter sp. TR13]